MRVDIESHVLVKVGERVIGTEGNKDFISDALDIERQVCGRLEGHAARQ